MRDGPGPALAAVIGVSAVWGATYSQMKVAVEAYPLFALLALRFAIASLALVPVSWRRAGFGRRGVASGVVLGVVLAVAYALQTAGLRQVGATEAGFTTSLFVPLTPLLASTLFRERIGRGAWIATGLATGGLVLLGGSADAPAEAEGLVLAGAACLALHVVLTGRMAGRHDPRQLTLVQMAACATAFGVAALAMEQPPVPRGASLWAAILVTALLASALAYTVQTWAQRRLSATETAVAIAAEPVFAGLMGYLLLGERLGGAALVGCLVILVAVVTAAGRPLRRAPVR